MQYRTEQSATMVIVTGCSEEQPEPNVVIIRYSEEKK
jgi:hypothetical protein